ncbi:MAG TPA: NAD-binding oxidoreductase [bacterium]|nr:NAD-binding oxidoreductase [bacterium]
MADDFKTVRIARAWDESPRLRAFSLDLSGTDFAQRFTIPGQYVKARIPGEAKDAFLALASAPGVREAELLLQKSGGAEPNTVDLVARLGAGDALEITAPAGKGFAIDAAKGQDVIGPAGGSGISAVRSVIEHVAAHRDDYGRAVLLLGARTVDELAYRSLFERWKKARIDVDVALSRPAQGTWPGRTGYVTSLLGELKVDAPRTWVAVAGGKPFVSAVTESLTGMGVPAERISKNF